MKQILRNTVLLLTIASVLFSCSKETATTPKPTKVTVNKITVTAMPFGSDLLDGPDVYFKIINSSNVALYTQSTYFPNVALGALPVSHTLSPAFTTTDLTTGFFVDVWDYDTLDADDNIGYVLFYLPSYTSGSNAYPTTVTNTSNGVTITLNLTWQ